MGRPSRSCHMCRTRRIKCDRTKPICNQCVTKRLQCPGYELQFDVIHRSENEAVKCRAQKISTPRRSSGKNISEPSPASASPGNHNLPPLAPAGTLSGGQAVNGYTDLQGTPDESRLHYRNIEIYLSCFRKYIPPLCPLLRPDELTSSNIVSLRESDQPAQKAVALAVLALGEWCWNAGDAPCTATRVDRTNAREAANFLEHHTNRDLHHIRACLLIAFYCGLCGDVCGSKRYVHKAAELLKQDLSPESLRGTITSENSFPIAFWICIALERYGTPLGRTSSC
ncbi:hypothetical protein N656DRAFT_559914 [Canariomyces notabilis]|uniref:Zn(2)-C6 fungal-type domain-containing protein n=1 Tax=Canariomyces notabilis TaxID=2074819 RepID=A0AAN6T701_9PEZI|nr:hypothetical protein N656DRAFT_559914 [Canariomyces arenarius]